MNKKLLVFVFTLLAFAGRSQIVITPGGTATSMVTGLVGAGLTISNATINCTSAAYGTFSGGGTTTMGLNNGIIMTTGSATGAASANNSASYGVCNGTSNADPDLTGLEPQATLDPCILEFDLIPQCNSLTIRFVFGSEEYPEFVSSGYNDAFGFFITGPNPSGGSYTGYDVARIPPSTIVSIDNVNAGVNPSYYINNAGGTSIQYDGLTTQITSTLNLIPCQTYHFKLAIADAGDCFYDSGVFVDFLQCTNVTTLSTTNTPATTCGVNDGTADVSVFDGFGPFTYNWSPAPGTGQGTASATGLTSGTTYTVTVDDAYACIPPITTTVTIGGPVAPTVALTSPVICNGLPATITATPSSGGGTYLWSPGGATTSSITVSPSSTVTYSCDYTLSGCTGSSTGTITVNPQPTISTVPAVCSDAAAGNLTVDVAGGSWIGTGITSASAGTFDPSAATIGNNVVTYTAPGGCTDTAHAFVIAAANAAWTQPPTICAADAPINLNGFVTGTPGGTFIGTGVSGTMFNPFGLSGSIAILYAVGTSCPDTLEQDIFVSPNTPPNITAVSAQCASNAPFNLIADIAGGTWSGGAITNASSGTFDPSIAVGGLNQVIYTAPGCSGADTIQVAVIPASNPAWSTTSMCSGSGVINLDTTITGTIGGVWSGTGVTGSSFDPAGLSGPVAITYTVGPAGCQFTSTQNITINPSSNPAWTTSSICASASAVNLDATITGTSGGTWSGTGITGSSFDPAGLSGPIAVTYTVGTTPCTSSSTQNMTVIPSSNPAWTTTSMCATAPAINLDTTITGTSGGTWSGSGVTGSTFNPAGLSGPIAVTYTVGTVPCQSTSIQNITVTPAGSAAWTTASICSTATPLNLNTLVTGTSGGTWSGTGVTGSSFDPTGLSGSIAVTYSVGAAPCITTSTQNITVIPGANPAWTTTPLCANATPVNLNTLVTGTSGGTWSGTGVIGSTFNPSGLSGSIAVTYTVGTAPCLQTSTQNIVVTPNANATINAVSALCVNASSINLTAANTGGTWSGTGITNPATGTFNPTVATPGTYIITYTIGGACGAVDTVSVTVLPNPSAAWTLPPSICENGSPIDLNMLVTGVTGGTWSGAGVTGNTFDPSGLSGNTTITYTATQNGCTSVLSHTINVENITASFTATPSSGLAPLNVSLSNSSVNAVSYDWSFGNGATSTATNPSTVYDTFGDYVISLTATSANGCTDVTTVTVHVDEVSALVIPNVFTPNGDGANETFHPIVAKGLTDFKAVVYDRWGLKMFDWTDVNSGWDGKAKNGGPAPDGTYFYIITGKGADGKDYQYDGFVQLLRER